MNKSGDGASLEDLQEKRMGGTVLVWVLDAADIGIAQNVAKALCRSVGLDDETSLMTVSDVVEKGGGLLGADAGGLLVLCPRGAQVSVEAVDFVNAPAFARL